jgi:GABA(A) receptor-associated protein
MSNIEYKKERSFKKRLKESSSITTKYPDRIPVICERSGDNIEKLDKQKFLVPRDITLGQFILVIRKRINISKEQSIFCFINNTLPIISSNMGALYENNKDEDGFLYILYSGENCFGCGCFNIPCLKKNFTVAINRISSFNLFEKKDKKYDITTPDISLNNIINNDNDSSYSDTAIQTSIENESSDSDSEKYIETSDKKSKISEDYSDYDVI